MPRSPSAPADARPGDWAPTQLPRATALLTLGRLSGQASALRAAVMGYDNALFVLTLDGFPTDWAIAQSSRAVALQNIVWDLSGDTDALQEAVAGYDAALHVQTRTDSVPGAWARTQSNRVSALLQAHHTCASAVKSVLQRLTPRCFFVVYVAALRSCRQRGLSG